MNVDSQTDSLLIKGLPCATDAERFVLGSILLGHSIGGITATLRVDDFATERHRRIFGAMVGLEATGCPVDRVTVVTELQRRGQLESVDGMSYLVSLDDGLPQILNLDAYVNIIRDKSILRQAIRAHQAAIEECLAAIDPTPEILERAERTIAGLAVETRSLDFRNPTEVIKRAGGMNAFQDAQTGRGVETPWPSLNLQLSGRGFTPGQMVVIGARPSMGKTALGCQIADHAAMNGIGVAFFTLEMADDAILLRMAAARAQVDSLKVTQGSASEEEIRALSQTFADLAKPNCRLWIDDTTGCTIPAMRAALRKLTAHHEIGMVVIDYLQLVETSGGSERRRYEQVTEISRGMKRMAREFGVVMIVLAQLNREMEKGSREPRPSDLRDSGAIEQDADVILMPTRRDGQTNQADVVCTDLIIAKQRNGPLGRIPLNFLKRYAKFVEAR